MIRITFALRSDALGKPGGDTTKVDRYIRGIASKEVVCTVVHSVSELRASNPDLVHVMNLDLPLENLAYARQARKIGAKVALSTICHPFDGIAGMYESGNDRYYVALRRLGIPPEVGVNMRERLKLLSRGQLRAVGGPLQYTAAQRALIKQVDLVLPMAEGEEAYLRNRFGLDQKSVVVRNGFTFEPQDQSQSRAEVAYDAIAVGRIEPRKNSLEVALAAQDAGLKIAFAGSLNSNHSEYTGKFLQVAADAESGVTYLGKLSHGELQIAISRARAYVNAAWFEVVSQADMEAAGLGIPVVTTKNSYIEDSLGTGLVRLDPASLVGPSPAEALRDALEAAVLPPVVRVGQNWAEAGSILLKAYKETVSI